MVILPCIAVKFMILLNSQIILTLIRINKMRPEISIIIPVYNTEKYLYECINSVISASDEDNTEIVFINDGSTDNSFNVLQEYKNKHKNITVIDKDNAGLAAARNSGIQAATGEYIMFLDSDDYLLNQGGENAIKLLLKTARQTNADVLCFNYTRKNDHSPERKAPKGITSNADFLVQNNIYTSSACTKLIRKSILIENKVFFEEGTLSEDILFCAKLLGTVNVKVAFLNEILYFYRQREGSITNSINTKHITDIINIINTLEKSSNKNVLCYAAFQYATLLININLSDKKADDNILKEMKKLSYLLKHNSSTLIRAIKFANDVFGVRITSKLMAFAFKIKRWKNR